MYYILQRLSKLLPSFYFHIYPVAIMAPTVLFILQWPEECTIIIFLVPVILLLLIYQSLAVYSKHY